MTQFEYKVVPAPHRGLKARGIKGAEARFAFAVQTVMNDHAAQGWEFMRAETLGSEERHGLTSAQTVYRDLLVFRRPRAQPAMGEDGQAAVAPAATPEPRSETADTEDLPPADDGAGAEDSAIAQGDGDVPDTEPASHPATTFETARRD